MTEKAMWDSLRANLPRHAEAHLCRHEDRLQNGIPDLSYGIDGVEGWIELKKTAAPARGETPISFSRYTMEQRRWLLERGKAGGRCWLLVRVESDWYLFGHYGAQIADQIPYTDLPGLALGYWKNGCNWKELIWILKNKSHDAHCVRPFIGTSEP